MSVSVCVGGGEGGVDLFSLCQDLLITYIVLAFSDSEEN